MEDGIKKLVIKISIVGFSSIVVIFLFIKGALAVYHGESRELWIIIGMASILMLILSEKKGATVFLAILIIGTLVAREEFLLEIAALSRGENLSELRRTRSFVYQPENQPEIDIQKLAERLELSLKQNKKPAQIVKDLETLRAELDIQRDLIVLNDTHKEIIKFFATYGVLYPSGEEKIEKYFNQRGIKENDFSLNAQFLINKGYLYNGQDSVYLTKLGLQLAERMGLKPVPINVNSTEQDHQADG